MGKKTQSVDELVKLMKALKYPELDLTLLGDRSDVPEKLQRSKYYGPRWLTAAQATLWIATATGLVAMLGGKNSDPDPWVAAHYDIAIPIWLLIAALTIFIQLKANEFLRARRTEFLRRNPLLPSASKTKFAGDLSKGSGVSEGYHPTRDKSSPLVAVSFGMVVGWWDPDSNPPRDGHGNLVPHFFIRVGLDSLRQEVVYVTPKRHAIRESLPPMSDRAFSALQSLGSKYAVCIGKGGIMVMQAAGTKNAFEYSAMNGMDTPQGWRLAYRLISGPLADLTFGLE